MHWPVSWSGRLREANRRGLMSEYIVPAIPGNLTVGSSHVSLWRRFVNHLMTAVAVATLVIVLVPLVAIFGYLLYRGIGSINWAFLTQTPKPVGEAGGGMANAIVGSAFILAIGSLLGVPLGIGGGIYLSEYGRNRFGDAIPVSYTHLRAHETPEQL